MTAPRMVNPSVVYSCESFEIETVPGKWLVRDGRSDQSE
jgi:hypothetical protein